MALLRRLSFIMFFIGLVGCGGGDGGLNNGGGTTPDPDTGGTTDEVVITLSISPIDTAVSESTPVTITAKVTQGDSAVTGKLVTFTLSDSELAFFQTGNGSVPTDTSGLAEITLVAGGKSGGGEITASINSGEVSSEPLPFESLGDGNDGATQVVETISLFTSSPQIASSGTDEITLTAIAKDSNNNLLEGAIVSFSADSGQIQIVNSITGVDGKSVAILKTDNEAENRVISVTATSDSKSDELKIQVVGTTVAFTGSASLALNDTNTYIVNVLDSDGHGLANKEVQLSLTNQSSETPAGDVAQLSIPTTVTTDFTGQATVEVTGTTGGTNTIIANVLGATVQKNITVQEDSFLFTSFNNGNGSIINPSLSPVIPDVLLSDSSTVTLTWLKSGNPIPDGTLVNFTTTRGELAIDAATTVNGQVSAIITSSNAGKALVTFSGKNGDVSLDNQIEFEFVAEDAATIIAQASPNSVGPNGETSTISVVVKDANGNLVKNKTVTFNLIDTNGGSIFPASAVTDSNGTASTVYTSNTTSAKDGISITASVDGLSDTVSLTVADRELFISLGTGNDLIEVDQTTYNKQYTVFVTDADSTPIENATLKVSAIPSHFYKGTWGHVLDEEGNFEIWAAFTSIKCDNEDQNLDGILDFGEDINGDSTLTPGNVVAATGEVVTDEQGRAVIDILYPQSSAQWVDIKLIASAKVNGTENIAQSTFTLPVLADDVNKEFVTPPVANTNLRSPFGATASCSTID